MDLDTLEREVRAGMSGPGYTAIAIDGRELLDLIARVRAAEAERDRLRAERDEAYSRALQAAADVVVQADVTVAYIDPDESEMLAWIDDLANDILELSADEIDAFAEQQEQAHGAESGER